MRASLSSLHVSRRSASGDTTPSLLAGQLEKATVIGGFETVFHVLHGFSGMIDSDDSASR